MMHDYVNHSKTTLAACVHFLHQRGWAPATSSNYSFRSPDTSNFWVSASGKDKGEFSEADFLEVTPEGQALAPGAKPSAETLLHALIYQRVPEAACILHTHSIFNTIVSAALHSRGEAELTLAGFELLKALPGVTSHEASIQLPIFANSQDMVALSGEIATYWAEHPQMQGFLLSGHGFYTWGSSIAEAKRSMEAFEFLFECTYRMWLLKN